MRVLGGLTPSRPVTTVKVSTEPATPPLPNGSDRYSDDRTRLGVGGLAPYTRRADTTERAPRPTQP